MKTWITAFLLLFIAGSGFAQEYYELKKYTISSEAQEKRLDDYLKNAYIPAARKAGISAVGVFKPVASDKENFGKVLFVLTPYPNLAVFEKLPALLEKNADYREKGKDYLEAAHDNAPYKRIEGTLMRAFSGSGKYKKPALKSAPSQRVYELRSYEGATERRYLNKVAMFNKGGEISIFNRLGFNPMFYGEVLAGKDQPNMIYMTTFEDMNSRDAHWKSFTTDSEWEKLKIDPNYQNNVSGRWTFLLFPTDYSDL